MSGIASLYNVPSTGDELAEWSFDHMAHHRDIISKIYALENVQLPEYILDPIDPNNPGVWEYQHQLMHDAQNFVLGIQGQDLTGVNWKDPNLTATWIWVNGNEHFQAADILEIG